MPAVSKKQEKFMQAVAHNPAFAKKVGVPTKVGKEFTKSGGGMATKSAKMGQMKKPAATVKKAGAVPAYARPMMDKKADQTKKAGVVPAYARPFLDKMTGTKKAAGAGPRPAGGMGMMGGRPATSPPTQSQMNQMGARLGAAAGLGRSARPGPATSPPTQSQMNQMGARLGAAARSGMPMKKMASGGLAAGHKSADGIASKGKTKAKQISMAGSKGMKYGGKC